MVVVQHVSQYGKPDEEVHAPEENKPENPGVMGSSGLPELPNHIEEYLKNNVGENAFRDLFEGTEENIDLRTELNENEVDCVNKIFINNEFLKAKLGSDIYHEFLINYMRLKVSFNRGSRVEFVDINRKDRFEQNLQRFGNFANLSKVKE